MPPPGGRVTRAVVMAALWRKAERGGKEACFEGCGGLHLIGSVRWVVCAERSLDMVLACVDQPASLHYARHKSTAVRTNRAISRCLVALGTVWVPAGHISQRYCNPAPLPYLFLSRHDLGLQGACTLLGLGASAGTGMEHVIVSREV